MVDERKTTPEAAPPAPDRTALAKFRTQLALDRTTLAWIRTTLTMATFGFGTVAFFRTLREKSPTRTRAHTAGRRSRATAFAVSKLVRPVGAAVLAALLLAGSARADPRELWPEANVYVRLGPTTRLYFVAADSKGKDSPLRTLDLAGSFDLTLNPLFSSLQEDWQRKKYFWVRVGYDQVFKIESGSLVELENRGILATHARAYLPAEILVEGRARADLRWIDGDYSTRYRLRLEVNRTFALTDHSVTPYVQIEMFYDTRYDGWARQLYQVGTEVQVVGRFNVEPYVARQVDTLPSSSGLWALGIVARWYL